MSLPNLLIDTNVFIGLEDPREVPANWASLMALTAKHHIGIFIHEAARDDIARDTDKTRRAVSLSKAAKFQLISKVQGLTSAELAAQFGPLPKHNDVVDATLLHALHLGVADFLITEDRGLHERARKYAPELSRRILFVADAVLLLRATYEDIPVPLRFVEEVDAHAIPLSNPIFDSLREGYPKFDKWWQEKCVKARRKCWIVSDPELAGIVVRKDERPGDTDATLSGNKILKVCTFKVRQESRGTKLGELLLRQVLWYAQANHYEVVYLTTFPAQSALIDLIEYYGFTKTKTAADGEMTYERRMALAPIVLVPGQSLFDTARLNYPCFVQDEASVESYGIPIREDYHDILFPELKDVKQPDLFGFDGGTIGPRRPGNTIRKVYLCRAQANITQPGAILAFYKGASKNPPSQAITTIGIFEDMSLARSASELMQLAGGRSVYSERQLPRWFAGDTRPVKVINFLLAGHIIAPYSLPELIEAQIFQRHPPQSILRLSPSDATTILTRLSLTLGNA